MFLIKEFIALLCANLIFTQALGTSTMIVAAKNKVNLAKIGLTITFFVTSASMIAYFIDRLIPAKSDYLLLICYVAVIAIIYVAALIILNVANKNFFEKCKLYIHLSAYNCAVAGSIFTVHNKALETGNFDLSYYALFGLQSGFGFVVAALFLMAAYKNLNSSKVPASFRGLPAMLVYIGMISMAVYSLGSNI